MSTGKKMAVAFSLLLSVLMTGLYLYSKHEAEQFLAYMEQEMEAMDESIILLKEVATEFYADTRSEQEQREEIYLRNLEVGASEEDAKRYAQEALTSHEKADLIYEYILGYDEDRRMLEEALKELRAAIN